MRFSLNNFLFLILFFLTSCNTFFYYPDNKIYLTPSVLKCKYREFFISTDDGKKLYAWLIYARSKPKGTIIQFHGNAENLTSHFISLLWVIKYGYNLFTFDYRGYGKSTGAPSNEGLIKDGIAILNWIIKNPYRLKLGKKLIIYGQSLGGVVAIEVLSFLKDCSHFSLLVVEGGFHSYIEIAKEKIYHSFLCFLYPLVPLLISDKNSPKNLISNICKIKKLIIHSKNDEVVPLSFGLALYKMLPPPKKLWIISEGGHIQTFFVKRGFYRKSLWNIWKI